MWHIEKISGFLGARLTGVSLAGADDDALDTVRSALFEHGVLVLPEQFLMPQVHIRLAKRFGEIEINRFFTPVPDFPMIAEVRTEAKQTAVIGGTWHTDHSYDAAPAMCSILSAQHLPPVGGDTHFASMTAAYNALSPGLRETLKSLRAEHSDGSFASSKLGLGLGNDKSAFRAPVTHPVVIRHPETGVPAIYVNGDFTTRFDGWTPAESAPLLAYLYQFVTQPIFTCRVVWEPGMVAIWDNRLVQHYATADYPGHTRLMHRITVKGVPLEAA